jgi:hypothetical protein
MELKGMAEIVLRFGRYTFDGNALPRPQLVDGSARNLLINVTFSGLPHVQ